MTCSFDLDHYRELLAAARAGGELLVRAPLAPVLVRVRPVDVRPRRLHHVQEPLDRLPHVLGIRVVPGQHRVEALVAVDVRPDRVEAHSMAQPAQPLDRRRARRRIEVVELAPRHQEVRRDRARLRLQLGRRQGGVERQVDVVAEQHRPRLGRPVEEGEPVAARPRRFEQLAVVPEVEAAAHSVSTYSFSAADSASSSAWTLVSPVAIT